jgi:hypothetical protein
MKSNEKCTPKCNALHTDINVSFSVTLLTFVRFVFSIKTGPLVLSCGVGNFGNICSACGQHGIQHTKRIINKFTYNYMFYFACVFV